MKKLKQNKGITLIALIITIIVMLILVGVTINVVLTGGLFDKADEATKLTQIEAEKEELLSAVVAAIGNDGKVDFPYLDNNLPAEWSGTNGTYTSPKGNAYTVDLNGKIAYTRESSGGGNAPVAFDWTKFGLVDIDTTANYTNYSYWVVNFSTDGKMKVYNNGELYYELDATSPDIEDLYFENRMSSILYGYTITMNANNKDIDFKYEMLEGSSGGGTDTLIKEVVDNQNIYSNEEVLKVLGIINSAGTYTGTWEVMERDASGNPTKFVSTMAVTNVTLGEWSNLEKSISDYKNAVSILNSAAEEATGITGARSINLEDIETLAGIEDSDKGEDYNKPYTYNYTNHKDQIFVDESGATVKMDSEGKEVILKNTYYYKTLSSDDIGTLASGYYWLASPCVDCNSNNAYFYVRCMSSGSISYSNLFSSNGNAYNGSIGVRAVVSVSGL